MRYAGRSRLVAVPTTTTSSPSPTRHAADPAPGKTGCRVPAAAGCPAPHPGRAPSSNEVALSDAVATAETELVLAPSGTISSGSPCLSGPRLEHCRQLAIAIRQRIETRLAGRVRNLAVRIHGETVVLEGRCATYYSKQLAQHAALGVLDGQQLENAIVVMM